jgi:hypothetical protein
MNMLIKYKTRIYIALNTSQYISYIFTLQKVKTLNYINRQNQSTTGKLCPSSIDGFWLPFISIVNPHLLNEAVFVFTISADIRNARHWSTLFVCFTLFINSHDLPYIFTLQKVKTLNYINRQNQSTTGKLWKP